MMYTQEEWNKNGNCGGIHFTVTVRINRWAKVGEMIDGRKIWYPRVHSTGKTLQHVYFDNVEEALQYANDMGEKILTHIKGKQQTNCNRGVNLSSIFTEEALIMSKNLIRNEDDNKLWFDYRFTEVYPYTYGVGISKSVWKE